MEPTKFLLSEKDIPSAWYNIQADLPDRVKPVLHPGTGEPIGPGDLAPLFPMGLIEQRCPPNAISRSPNRFSMSTDCGDRRRSLERDNWKKSWGRRRAFTTNTKV